MSDVAKETAIRTAIVGFFSEPPYNHPDARARKSSQSTDSHGTEVEKGMYVMSSLLHGWEQRVTDVRERLQQHADEARAKSSDPAFKFDVLDGKPHLSQIRAKASPESWNEVRDVVFEAYGVKPAPVAKAPRTAPRDLVNALA